MSNPFDTQALLRLMAWLSPAFPVGGFAWSGGLERAVHDRLVQTAPDLQAWIETVLAHGSLWNDAVLFCEAWRRSAAVSATAALAGDQDMHVLQPQGRAPENLGSGEGPGEGTEDLAALAQLGLALAGSMERHAETLSLGKAFIAAAVAWPHPVFDRLPQDLPFPVAVGAVAAAHGVPAEQALAAYLHAAVSQWISAAIRLGVCGQADGVAVLAAIEAPIGVLAEKASITGLDDLGSATVQAEIASLRHETQHSRLFRS